MDQPHIVVCENLAAAQYTAAEHMSQFIQQQIGRTGDCIIGLSGGNTPRGLYERLAQEPFRSQIDWQRVLLIWSDERYVPHTDSESCYRLAREAMIDHLPIPPEQIYPIPTAAADPHQAAASYDQQIRTLLKTHYNSLGLMLLGMGPDGHTASLFPHHAGLHATAEQLAIAIEHSPKPPPRRISLTASALNAAEQIIFLVTGADKAPALYAVLHGDAQPEAYPAQLIRPNQGNVTWIADAAAASDLPS